MKPNTTYTFKPVSCGGIAFAVILTDNIVPNQATKQLNLTGKYINEGESATFTTPSNVNSYSVMWLAGGKIGIHLVYPNVQFMLVAGTNAPTTYKPYIWHTNTLTLPETVYGGEVDAVTGDGQETWKTINLPKTGWVKDSSTTFTRFNNYTALKAPANSKEQFKNILCNILPSKNTSDGDTAIQLENANTTMLRISVSGIKTLEDFLSFLDTYSVQVCYKLAEPVPFTATGAQPIPAMSGVNTLYTDADGVVVTGAEDQKHTITELKNAIISLGGNV